MALIRRSFGFQPSRLRDQLFGLAITPEDFLSPMGDLLDIMDRPVLSREYSRPWRRLIAAAQDAGSTIKTDKNQFQVNLDVQHFGPEEITVKTLDGYIVIEGKHEEKEDDHGFISRQFSRRYALPKDCDAQNVQSKLSSDGVLTVTAPRNTSEVKTERVIPITYTGPVRRKRVEEEENGSAADDAMNGDAAAEVKSAQKKRKR